jgi:hypothetical protein
MFELAWSIKILFIVYFVENFNGYSNFWDKIPPLFNMKKKS